MTKAKEKKATKKIQPLGPLQKKWLKELESGKYKQTRNYLHNSKGFCCLGIACEIVLGMKPKTKDGFGSFVFGAQNLNTELPPTAIRKMKFRSSKGKTKDDDYKKDLASLNDGLDLEKKKSFKEIAAIVRKDPSVYFTAPA